MIPHYTQQHSQKFVSVILDENEKEPTQYYCMSCNGLHNGEGVTVHIILRDTVLPS